LVKLKSISKWLLAAVMRCRPLDREFICMCDFKNISWGYESILYDMRVYSWFKIGFIMIGIGRDAVKSDFE
jgi:hypothetical protein